MQVTRINLTADASRGMPALGKDGTPAVFSDAVRVDLAECSLLFISGKTPVDENHKVVGSTMAEQTEQVLKNIKKVLDREGATFDDVVRVRSSRPGLMTSLCTTFMRCDRVISTRANIRQARSFRSQAWYVTPA